MWSLFHTHMDLWSWGVLVPYKQLEWSHQVLLYNRNTELYLSVHPNENIPLYLILLNFLTFYVQKIILDCSAMN